MKKEDKVNLAIAGLTLPAFGLGAKLAIRGARLRALEKLKPKFTTSQANEFKSRLQPGDVLLIGKSGLSGKASQSAKFTRLSEGHHVHSAMYVGNGKLIDLVPKGGPKTGGQIRKMNIDSYLNENMNILVQRPKGSKEQIQRSVQNMEDFFKNKNYKYDFSKPRVFAKGMIGDTGIEKKLTKVCLPGSKGKGVCSTMVADAQQKAGFKFKKNPSAMTTIDFRSKKNRPELEFKGSESKVYKTPKLRGVGLMTPGAIQAAYTYKQKAASAKILIPPPPKDSLNELALTTKARKNWVPNKGMDNAYDKKIPDLFYKFLKNQGIEHSREELYKLVESIQDVIMLHKNYFDRDRPHEYAEKMGVPFDHDYHKLFSAHTRSYPSGHTTQAFYLAFTLTDKYPEFKADFERIAKRVALSRLHRGVHYISDNTAGEHLAKVLHDRAIEKSASPILAGIVSLKEAGVL